MGNREENFVGEKRQKPPLCKGRWHGVSRDGGIDTKIDFEINK